MAWAAYYAKLGFGLLMLSGFITFSIYVIRRKLHLDRMAAQRLRTMFPKWLEPRARRLGGRVATTRTGWRVEAPVPGGRVEAEIDVKEPSAELRLRVWSDAAFAERWRYGGAGPEPGEADRSRLESIASKARLAGGTLRAQRTPWCQEFALTATGLWDPMSRAFETGWRLALEMGEGAARGAAPETGTCAVCGQAGADRPCAACGARHHEGCWSEAWGCAAPRCGGRFDSAAS